MVKKQFEPSCFIPKKNELMFGFIVLFLNETLVSDTLREFILSDLCSLFLFLKVNLMSNLS